MAEPAKRETISIGLAKITENVRSLLSEVDRIQSTAARASTILTHIAAEEAAKGFILVDYMRPYREVSPEMRSWHLRNVYQHLARGIYGKYYESRPDAFEEAQSIVTSYRVSHYLDGPNDVDWIFRNQIKEGRERELYVDLTLNEERLQWYSPTDWWQRYSMLQDLSEFTVLEPPICNIFLVMQEVGLFSQKALDIMAKTWKDISITKTTRWGSYVTVNQTFLKECEKKGLLSSGITNEAQEQIIDQFLYPLCGLDLGMVKVTAEELQATREQHLGFMYGEQY